jgi:2-aminobenzoate-CoA ligase
LQLALAKAPTLKRVVTCGDTESPAELQNLLAGKPCTFSSVDTAFDDPALVAFTSGTTGVPKGCVHSHSDILSMAYCFSENVLRPSPDDVFIGSPPLAFTFGLGALVVFPLMAGAASVLLEKGAPAELAAAVAHHRATICFTSPTGYRGLLSERETQDLSSLTKTVSAGEHLPLATYQAWLDATGIAMIDGLGATEMIHIFIAAAGDDIRPGATGKAIPGYTACVLDDNDHPVLRVGIGRLAVKGPTGCRYLDDERQCNYVIGGWNVTGDIYRQDEDGYFWFVGRGDDMIVSSGYNISGPEVEEVMLGHDAVVECAVVAFPDALRGQIPKAFVVLRPDYPPSDELITELQRWVKEHTAPYKYPRKIEFIKTLPKTDTGKIQRFKLRA